MADDFTIRVEGLNEVQAKLKRVAKQCPREASYAINQSLAVVSDETKSNTTNKILNVDTGRLRGSFGIGAKNLATATKLTGKVGSNVVYARIHEVGGMAGRGRKVKIPARRYFSLAIKSAMPKIKRIFNAALQRIVKA